MSNALRKGAGPALLIVAAMLVVWAVIATKNVYYKQGFIEGGNTVGQMVAAEKAGEFKDHSAAYSPAGDNSSMGYYTCGINDLSYNYSRAMGACANSTWNQIYYVEDNNGPDGNKWVRNIPIRGKYHYGCTRYGGQCGNASAH